MMVQSERRGYTPEEKQIHDDLLKALDAIHEESVLFKENAEKARLGEISVEEAINLSNNKEVDAQYHDASDRYKKMIESQMERLKNEEAVQETL